MSVAELRDHAHEILLVIADEMESAQSEDEREAKSKGLAEPRSKTTFAAVHGTSGPVFGSHPSVCSLCSDGRVPASID